MFLKIEIDSQDAIVYKLPKSDIIIGSIPSCHVVITDKTISKKHARIVFDEDQWFIVDQGSTNGTFIDEEQLVPGKRIKLETDQIVRLGSKALISLVEDGTNAVELPVPSTAPVTEVQNTSAQASISSDSDRTRVISLDDLKQAKAIADQKRAKELAQKRAAEKKRKREEQQRMARIIILCVLVIGGGVYANKWWQKKQQVSKKETIVKKLKVKAKAKEEITVDVEGFRIGRGSLLNRNTLVDFLRGSKCIGEKVTSFCEKATFSYGENGVVSDNSHNIIFFLEENEQMIFTKKQLPLESALDYDSLQKVSYLAFFKDLFSDRELDEKQQYYVSFYRYDDQKIPQLSTVFALNGTSAKIVLDELKKNDFNQPDEQVKHFITKVDEYFTTY